MRTYQQPLRIYLDTCCLSRPFDDQTQTRIRQETEVISWIIPQFDLGDWYWISSDVLVDEVEQIRDSDQRLQIKDLMTNVHQTVSIGAREILRGKQLGTLGFKEEDALHLACSESGSVDVFLTTDDKLLGKAKRDSSQLHVHVENPYTWLQEITANERDRIDK